MGGVAVHLLKTCVFLGSDRRTAIVEAVRSEFSTLPGDGVVVCSRVRHLGIVRPDGNGGWRIQPLP